MASLVLSSDTRSQLNTALTRPSHAYLFAGPKGLGKTTVAKTFAAKLIGPNASHGDIQKWLLFVAPVADKKISIKQVREIANFVSLKKPKTIANKIVIIDQADRMGIESANALLLTLEEPAADTVLILVSDNIADIPATLHSRLQKITFKTSSAESLSDSSDDWGIKSTLSARMGDLSAKLSKADESNLEQHENILEATNIFVSSDLIARLSLVSAFSQKDEISALIDALSRYISKNADGSHDWLKKANALILARIHLYNNGNPKFVLEKLALDFE